MPSLTARVSPTLFHVDYDLTLFDASIAFPIFVEPFVDGNVSQLRMESSEGINMEASTGVLSRFLTAQRTGPLTFRAIGFST